MFEQIKNLPQRRAVENLARAIAASETKSIYASLEKVDKYIAAGATEIVKGALNPADPTQVVVGLTAEALTSVAGLPEPTESTGARGPRGPIQFEIGEIEDLPEVSRGGNKGDSYPFEQLTAPVAKLDANNQPVVIDGIAKFKYAKFFVPSSEQRPNPAKSLQSTAASATKRYESEGRVFVARKVTDAKGEIIGANVIRTK